MFSTWQVTVYQMDGKTGTLDTSEWTADSLRRVEYTSRQERRRLRHTRARVRQGFRGNLGRTSISLSSGM